MSVLVENYTPLPSLRFSNTDNQGRAFGVLMIKAALDVEADGTCTLAPEQEPFNFTDATHGALNASSLRYPSDLVAYKPATDVIVNAIARAPEGRPARSWEVGVRVADGTGPRLEKRLRVTGPRRWEPQWRRALSEGERERWRQHRHLFRGWSLSEPEPALSVPIRYEHAYGGLMPKGLDTEERPVVEAHEANPVGCGWIDPDWSDHTQAVVAPQIEGLDEPVTQAGHTYPPQGFGPIPPAWLPRRTLGGTYDQAWIDGVWPRWPADYSFAFNNSAAAELTASPFLSGPITVELENLRPGGGRFRMTLPDIAPVILVTAREGEPCLVLPQLDTLVLDLAGTEVFDCRVLLTWRLVFHELETETLDVLLADEAGRRALAAEAGPLGQAPHPDACAVILTDDDSPTTTQEATV